MRPLQQLIQKIKEGVEQNNQASPEDQCPDALASDKLINQILGKDHIAENLSGAGKGEKKQKENVRR